MASMPATRLLAAGTLSCAASCAASNIINFVWGLPKQLSNLTFWILTVDILILCALLALGSLMRHEFVTKYFGFLQHLAGVGMLLMFIGSLVLGMVRAAATVTLTSSALCLSASQSHIRSLDLSFSLAFRRVTSVSLAVLRASPWAQ